MEHELTPDLTVVVMHPGDSVATALTEINPGEEITHEGRVIRVADRIPFGHKVALAPIAAGGLVYKYGEVIGRATCAIGPGEHVHVHNIEGTRGRGDLAPKGDT